MVHDITYILGHNQKTICNMALIKAKKKRVSKKLKASWRKHVDINDVEEFLEENRLEERLGFPSSISDNDLFQVDTKPSVELLSNKQRRKLKANKPLNCFSALHPSTKVPDPIAKRNCPRIGNKYKNDLIKKKKIQTTTNEKFKPKRDVKDLWEKDTVLGVEQDEWVSSNTKKHNLPELYMPVKQMEKKSPLPAVEYPHPGMSYNPSFQDHQDLLTIVAEKEINLIKKDEHLTRCTKGMFQKVSPNSRDESWLVEMSEGLPSQTGTNAEENESNDDEYKSVNPPAKNLKKTLKQRRKHKEQLEMEKRKRAIKLEKKKITDIYKLDILKKQVEKVEKKNSILKEKRMKRVERKKNETKILNATKFEDVDLEFNMQQDIAGNLKNLKTEGNLLLDRFKSMQKRNILAPTKRHTQKKPKVKKYVKPGHKDGDWKKTIAR